MERSAAVSDKLKAPSLSRGDVAIHLENFRGLPQSAKPPSQ